MPREGRLFEPAFLLLGSVDDEALTEDIRVRLALGSGLGRIRIIPSGMRSDNFSMVRRKRNCASLQ